MRAASSWLRLHGCTRFRKWWITIELVQRVNTLNSKKEIFLATNHYKHFMVILAKRGLEILEIFKNRKYCNWVGCSDGVKFCLPFGLDPTFNFNDLFFSLLMIELAALKMHPTITPRVTKAMMFCVQSMSSSKVLPV